MEPPPTATRRRPAWTYTQQDASPPAECPTCGRPVATPHCAECGERRPEPGRLAVRHLVGEAVEHVASFDGAFLRTLLALVRQPGVLTEAYLRGSRVRHTRPLQLFVIVNVAFFLLAPRVGLFRYAKPVPNHPTTAVEQTRIDRVLDRSWSGRLALRRMRERHERYDQFVARYNAVVDSRVSGFIGLFFLPPLAALSVVAAGRGRYLAAHAVFMLHFAAFALFWFPAGAFAGESLARAFDRPPTGWLGAAFAALLLGPPFAYLAVALRRVYGGSSAVALARGAVILAALAVSGILFVREIEAVTVWLL